MNISQDTIVAIATPLGVGGLGVVRLSGPNAVAIASALLPSSREIFLKAQSHTLHHAWIERNGQRIDEVVAALFRAPRSYTGEDVVELSCHGSPAVLKEVVKLAEQGGARMAGPGEFTQRAYLNGKMDLIQAEAVSDLIHAHSKSARAAATSQLEGTLSAKIKTLRSLLVDLLAPLEANLDFAEEDIPGLAPEEALTTIEAVQSDIEHLLATRLRGKIIRDGVRVAIVGKPNVGKSSLFNALLAQDRAIVTDIPGTTRDTLDETMDWEGTAVVLTDTAGIRDTTDVIEEHGTRRAKQARELAHVVLFVVDGSAPLAADDEKIARELLGKKAVVALNKRDLRAALDSAAVLKHLQLEHAVSISAKTGAGLTELQKAVLSAAYQNVPEAEASKVLTNERHISHLEKALERIIRAKSGFNEKRSEEAISIDIREAAQELGSITGDALSGRSVNEDVLTAIFSHFCIGK